MFVDEALHGFQFPGCCVSGMLVQVVPPIFGLDGVERYAEVDVGDGLFDAGVVGFFVAFVFV